MSSAAKTLELLAHFTTARPEIGLSSLTRLAGRDKATTYRHLQALEEVGFVEQNPATKQYRLGPAVLRLAQTREATVPRKAAAEAALVGLAEATGETSHVSVLSGATLHSLASCESHHHSTRVIIDVDVLPLHATASGLCALAFGPPELLEGLDDTLEVFTASTLATPQKVARAAAQIRDTGFAQTDRHYEENTHSISAPVFDQTGHFAGAVSVASVATRYTPELDVRVKQSLVTAARDITQNWGGIVPHSVETAWSHTLANILDKAS
ncbi:IclR family transcriptional regulator [Rhodobacteraceae bacterium N5(2021)]|uniref:IclR family transcriptional regulator n=1 Tax=Gymnodinialimonas phycosphaerae TaxID=2841589 RepID=A0A975TRP6_9RHOB|nr:IclR family transcriptional regulator [Gymnodinialimonas phycosphaerae]MBY4893308.1 IclR family transcriptional regulator [Gymnodinialimonas phycosphaerae]